MTREVTMTCDACSRVIDGINADQDRIRGTSDGSGMDLCDWCMDDVQEFLRQKRIAKVMPNGGVKSAAEVQPHREPRETQQSISAWAEATFGPAVSNMSCADRANVEMFELLTALAADDKNPKARIECADIVIVLYRLCERNGWDLHAAIDEKMATNRNRKWTSDGNGHGQHVEEDLNIDAVKRALIGEEPDAPVFKPGKPIKPIEMKEPDIAQVHLKRHAATMLGAENDALWSHVYACRKSRAAKEVLDRRNAEIAALLPAGWVLVGVTHPTLDAMVYLVFGSAPAPDIAVVYNDEKLSAAAVADLIRNRAKS